MTSSDAYRWLPLISALTEEYGSRQERWRFTIFFLSETRSYNPLDSPYFRVARRKDGRGLVTTGLFRSHDFPAGASVTLEGRGWRKATNKYEADFLLDLDSDWSLSDGFWHGLAGAGTLAEVSADDFLHLHLDEADEATVLAAFNPTTKGDFVYHHLDGEGRSLQKSRVALDLAPLGPHVKPKLSPEERESFLAKHRSSIPDVVNWTDVMIIEAETYGL
jgi:hypothetical protein